MSNEILEFTELQEGFLTQDYISAEEETRIRSEYKDKINKDDLISPILVYQLEKELKRLNRQWHIEGKLVVEKGFTGEDASVYLHFDYKNMSISVMPQFKDGRRRLTRHRNIDEFAWHYSYNASINHPYFEGPSVFAYANPSQTKWIYYYSPYDGAPGTAFERSDTLLTPSKLYKELTRLEEEKGVLKKGHVDHT